MLLLKPRHFLRTEGAIKKVNARLFPRYPRRWWQWIQMTGALGCVHIEIYGIRYMVFAICYSVFAARYTGTAVHIEVARAVSVLFS